MNDGSTTFPINYYRTLGPTRTKNVNFDNGFDIHFNNLGFYPYQQNVVNGRTKNDAWSNYWAWYINELYDVASRLVTMNIVLNPNEIQSIQLNSKIFIDGHYYRINKIQGANLIERQSTKVELLKTLPRKLPFPRRRIYIKPNAFVDVIQKEFNIDGTTGYTTYDGNIDVTDPLILVQASTRDGNSLFENTVVWNTVKQTIYNPSISVVGSANYDETSNNVFVLGNVTQIPSNTNNVGLFNITREKNAYTAETTYVGSTTIQNRLATEYKVLSLARNDTFSVNSIKDEYPYYLFDWSGSNVGSNLFILPSATELDGVNYQLQLSSSYTAGRSLVISAAKFNETIDGLPSISLTSTGSLYEIKSVNGNWITTINPNPGSTTPPIPTASGSQPPRVLIPNTAYILTEGSQANLYELYVYGDLTLEKGTVTLPFGTGSIINNPLLTIDTELYNNGIINNGGIIQYPI
jgi:hypothetical protein